MINNQKENPYLSIVIASRNDDHGENLIQRRQASLDGLFEQLEGHRIESEIIIVEWNPPADKPLLKDVIIWPNKMRYCTIKIIEVPFSIHQKYDNFEKFLINVVAAVNCGIKRARGEFILPGVSDLFYSEELMTFIASKALKINERYRVDRCDVKRDVLNCHNLKDKLRCCEDNIIRIHGFDFQGHKGLPLLHTDACGDFQLMSRKYWHLLRGYWESDIVGGFVDSILSYCSFSAGVKEVVLNDPLRIYHIDHSSNFNSRIKIYRPFFHKTLSSCFNYFKFIIPMKTRKKIIFSYHKAIKKKSKSEILGTPVLDYIDYLDLAREIVSKKRSYVLNNKDWGLAKEVLSETIINVADWDNNVYNKKDDKKR